MKQFVYKNKKWFLMLIYFLCTNLSLFSIPDTSISGITFSLKNLKNKKFLAVKYLTQRTMQLITTKNQHFLTSQWTFWTPPPNQQILIYNQSKRNKGLRIFLSSKTINEIPEFGFDINASENHWIFTESNLEEHKKRLWNRNIKKETKVKNGFLIQNGETKLYLSSNRAGNIEFVETPNNYSIWKIEII